MQESLLKQKAYLALLKRRKWTYLLPAVIISIITAVVAYILPPLYRSQATIFIEDQEIPPDIVSTTVTSYVEKRLQTIHQRIMSFTPLLKIIKDHDLYPEMKDKYSTEEIVERMRNDTILEPISAEVVDRRTARQTSAIIAFTLSYQGIDPHTVQRVTNVIASLFLEENLKQRVQLVEETTAFLQTELSRLRKELSDLDTKFTDFKRMHTNELPEMIQVNQQSINNIERSIQSVMQQQRSLKEREVHLQSQLGNISPYLEKEERKRLETLKLQLIELTKLYSDEYPDVKKIRREIKELEANLARGHKPGAALPDNPAYIAITSQLAGVRAELKSITLQLSGLEADAAEYRRRIAASSGIEDQYNGLILARQSTQTKYNELMENLMDAQVAQGLEKEQKGERFSLVEAPRLPEKPYKPNRAAIIMIGVVIGIGVGFTIASILLLTDKRIYSADVLQFETSFPILAGVPVLKTKKRFLAARLMRDVLAFQKNRNHTDLARDVRPDRVRRLSKQQFHQ